MKTLTFEECMVAHKKMWEWISENPNLFKSDWPGWEGGDDIGGIIKGVLIPHYCFACYWAYGEKRDSPWEWDRYSDIDRDCTKCPIIWEGQQQCTFLDGVPCSEPSAEYSKFCEFVNTKQKAKYAKIISEKEWYDNYQIPDTERE